MIQIPSFQTSSADFSLKINLNNQAVQIRLVWNIRNNSWHMDFTDPDGNIIYGIKLVPNWPLLEPHQALLNFQGDLFVFPSNNQAGTYITYDNLNSGWAFCFLLPSEKAIWKTNNGL